MSFARFAHQSLEESFRELKSSTQGLRNQSAQQRLEQSGANELQSQHISWPQIFFRQIATPFVALLGGATLISLLLGQIQEGLLVLLFILINSFLGFWQEYQSHKALELLKRYIQPSCHVLRDKTMKTIACRELVPGDIIELAAGDSVPADARLIETTNLLVDESILTGESEPRSKGITSIKKSHLQIHQADNLVFSASKIIEGKAKALVFATGRNSEVGQVATLTDESQHPSQFERGISKFSNFILRLVGITLALLFFVNILIKGGHANVVELLLFSVSLAVSVIPEALPLVMTISLSRGAVRLAKKNVVIKRLSSIEDLGSITILCTDKTGTITENNLTVVDVFGADRHATLVAAASAGSLSVHSRPKSASSNSFDLAIMNALDKHARQDMASRTAIHELPFDPGRRRNSTLIKFKDGYELISRGAPETLLSCCVKVTPAQKKKLLSWMAIQGQDGRRVLAIASKTLDHEIEDLKTEEHGLTLLGAIAFEDPLKPTAKHAIRKASESGIAVKILTGDSLDVAIAVGRQIGLIQSAEQAMTGEEFERLSTDGRHKAIQSHHIFARVSPEQKFHLIQEFQHHAEVGFLGEGINDAPGLKIADVGLVVKGATDVARDAADVILLNRSLDVIVNGIVEGRAVFANTVKYIRSTLTSNFGNFYSVAIASLFIDYLPMLPVQILLVNLLSDFPMIAVSTDHTDPEETRTPRQYDVRNILLFATTLGIVSSLFDFIYFAVFYHSAPAVLQTNWFIGSILTELLIVFSIRTKHFFLFGKGPSWQLLSLSVVAAAVTIILPYTQFGIHAFKFQTPTAHEIALTIGITITYFIVSEAVKLFIVRAHQQEPLPLNHKYKNNPAKAG